GADLAAAPAAAVPVQPGGTDLGGQVTPGAGRPVIEVFRYAEAFEHVHRTSEVRRADPAGPPVLGEHQRTRLAAPRAPPLRPPPLSPATPPPLHPPRPAPPPLRGALPGQRPPAVGDGHPDREVLLEVAV